MSLNGSTERRSDTDLQRMIDGLVGPSGSILTAELPDVIERYEKEHKIIILEEREHESLRSLCNTYPDLSLGSIELFAFLSTIPKPRPQSPNRGLPHSTSAPPNTLIPGETPIQQRRRQSDRIRAGPSDDSSSSEEDVQSRSSSRNQTSAQTESSRSSFPTGGHRVVSLGSRPAGPTRKKTVSDPSRSDSPLATRVRGAPPSAFHAGTSFARPSPAGGRRRRASQNTDDMSPNMHRPGNFSRSMSSGSLALGNLGTPTGWRDGSRPNSPLSPTDGTVDMTSFHRAKSPETGSEMDVAERTLMEDFDASINGESTGDMNGELDEVDDDVVGDRLISAEGDSSAARLTRIATDSATSLRTSHDKQRALQKQNAELDRKLKESEKQLAIQGSENERIVEDLQDRLEEARAEIIQRKKDEKELKSKDRTQLIQIAGLEADIQSLQRSLENSKANHANMQKMYNSQCEEAQRLRGILLDRDNEIKELEQIKQIHEDDEKKYTQEIQALEAEVKRIETELNLARQAESFLEAQKQENLQLKETIDRMRFDLDEARSSASKSNTGSVHLRGVTSSSGAGTLSRNLGDELTRRLLDAENGASARGLGADGEGDSVIETIVTTQRMRKVGSRGLAPAQKVREANHLITSDEGGLDAEESIDGPIIRIQEGVTRECADINTETDAVGVEENASSFAPKQNDEVEAEQSLGSPPAYTAKPEQISHEAILAHAHPHEHRDASSLSPPPEEAYDEVVQNLGVRCTVLEEEIRARKAKGGPSPRKRPHSAKVNYVFFRTTPSLRDQFIPVTIGAMGILLGVFLHMSVASHAHNQAISHLNGMNFAAGGRGADILAQYKDVVRVFGVASGRIPT